MLLEQMEEQKRQKEEAKRKRQQEEIEEEERIKKEIAIINAREKGEVEGKKNQQKEFKKNLDEQQERK